MVFWNIYEHIVVIVNRLQKGMLLLPIIFCHLHLVWVKFSLRFDHGVNIAWEIQVAYFVCRFLEIDRFRTPFSLHFTYNILRIMIFFVVTIYKKPCIYDMLIPQRRKKVRAKFCYQLVRVAKLFCTL